MLRKLLIIVIGVLIDYGSKLWVINQMAYHQSVKLCNFKNFGLNWFLTYNSGVAFGLFNYANGYINLFFSIVTIITIAGICYLLITNKIVDHLEKFSMLLVIAGALGNLIDRIIYGYVIDFIDFYLVFNNKNIHWYTFNFADSLICLGGGLFIYRNYIRHSLS